MNIPKPLVLIILDGFGIAKPGTGNAITTAKTPNIDNYLNNYPNTTLKCSGEAAGLPKGQMGNSEVGHLNIGAGRIVNQEFTRISKAIKNGSFFENPVLIQAIKNAKKRGSNLHLLGLLSNGGVHSHIEHLFALLDLCKKNDINPILHLFLDGRDTPPKSALTYIEQLEDRIKTINCGVISTITGRYYAMDRDRRWDRVEQAYKAMVKNSGYKARSASEAIKKAYARGETDEFVKPTTIKNGSCNNKNIAIKENDSVIFFNFRPDRAREITFAFIGPDFINFNRGNHPPHTFFVSLTQYDETFDIPVAFLPSQPKNILADILAKNNLKQLRIAETEKYAHVTFFFNGGEEIKRPFEKRILIPSPKVATYDLKPEMSANEVTEEVINQITTSDFDVIILNFANPDMVGHTGIFKATVKAIETIDNDLGLIVNTVKRKNGVVLITADHGNAEKMVEEGTDKPYTAHTTNKVPFILINTAKDTKLKKEGILADIAPTILDILDLEKPKEMTGKSLIV